MTKPDITLRLGTRASPLAMAQANAIAGALAHISDGRIAAVPVKFTTSGDRLTHQRLTEAGGKGLFTRELDRALDAGELDIAVHSLKDVPSQLPHGQEFVAFPPRADPREGFVCALASHPRDLDKGAIVGTASIRREAQTLRARPDLKIVNFRGSVQTRIAKLDAGEAAATYLAMAGLSRLGLEHLAHPIALEDMLPAPAQGIIGCVARTGTLAHEVVAALAALNDSDAHAAALAERGALTALDGSCRTPIAAHLFREDAGWRLACEVISLDGQTTWSAQAHAPLSAGESTLTGMGHNVGAQIREAAGGDLPTLGDND